MNTLLDTTAGARAESLKGRLRRFNLVFVQCGTVFEPLRESLLERLGGTRMGALKFAASSEDLDLTPPLILTEAEVFSATGRAGAATLGMLRQKVDAVLTDTNVCIFSSAPRMAYAAVPGSSLIDDAAPHFLHLLSEEEIPEQAIHSAGAQFPCISASPSGDLTSIFEASVGELGLECLAELDRALFEVGTRSSFLSFLDSRAQEAVRGAGLARLAEEGLEFAVPERVTEFSEAVAGALARVVEPPEAFALIGAGLWMIERRIRRKLRDVAISTYGASWRKRVLRGDLGSRVLERARADGCVSAVSTSQLRDPLEWLSLGELLEILRANEFDGLGVDAVTWNRFESEVVPIRNRLSHMRLLRKSDRDSVTMWSRRIVDALG